MTTAFKINCEKCNKEINKTAVMCFHCEHILRRSELLQILSNPKYKHIYDLALIYAQTKFKHALENDMIQLGPVPIEMEQMLYLENEFYSALKYYIRVCMDDDDLNKQLY